MIYETNGASVKYNQNCNISIWNSTKGTININYLIYLINDNNNDKLELIKFYKPYVDITKLSNVKKLILIKIMCQMSLYMNI